MTRVLKKDGASDAPAVHSLASAWAGRGTDPAVIPAEDPQILALRAENQALKDKLEQQKAKVSELNAEADAAFRKGEAKGREAALREAEDQGQKRLARLEAGIGHAQSAFAEAMENLERLAPALAHEALAAILGQADDRPQLVAAALRNQLQGLEARAIIQVEVSASDFPDDDALARLEGTLGSLGPVIHASVALKSGECRIRLKLGTLEVGLDRQWTGLAALLRDMAEGTEA